MGLGIGGASGKLMGLAPYGQARFFDRRFVGNMLDFQGYFEMSRKAGSFTAVVSPVRWVTTRAAMPIHWE